MKRRSIPALLLALLLLLAFAACSAKSQSSFDAGRAETPTEMNDSGESNTAYSMTDAPAASEEKSEETTAVQADAATRKIVYNADMGITADDPAKALESIIRENELLGGYLATSYTRTDELGAYHCNAELRVPADRLEQLVSSAEATGRVDSYQLSSDDITMSYYDIQARLKSAKAEEEQLLLILEKCETVEDIIVVRESLAEVRSDIESYQGQINVWDNLVSYATLYLNISRTARAAVETENELIAIWKASDVWNRMTRGFQNSARFVANAIGAIGIFLAYAILPALVVGTVIFLIVKLNKKCRAGAAARKEKRLQKRANRKALREAKKKIQNE